MKSYLLTTAVRKLNELAEAHVDENYHTEADLIWKLSALTSATARDHSEFYITVTDFLGDSVEIWKVLR